MELRELISRRKSTRSFSMAPVDEADLRRIRDFAALCRPLYPELPVRLDLIGIDAVRCILPWKTPHYVAVFTDDSPGAAENAGFLCQQLDLYIHSLGLGSCWLGMGRYDPRGDSAPPDTDGLRFLIMLAFGRPAGQLLRSGPEEFRRKSADAIADFPDPRLEPARLAPSSVNSQPWYFVHDGDIIHAYRTRSLLSRAGLDTMNRVDMGIALSHLYLSNPDTFRFFTVPAPPPVRGHEYTGSFSL